MNNMITLNEYFANKKEYLERINKLYLIKSIEDYGINNAILNLFLRKDITGIEGINGLMNILEGPQILKTENIMYIAKRRYLNHLLTFYVKPPLEPFYDEINITDQDIDSGNTKAIDSISKYVINQQTSRLSR